MSLVSGPHELLDTDVYVDLAGPFGRRLLLRCEGFNFGGSVKMRTAAALVAAAERDGDLRDDTVLVESSSGNLGVALSAVAAGRGIPFVCVTDTRCNPSTVRAMRAMGAEVEVITEPDEDGGLLGARKRRVRSLCRDNPHYLWLNQYENPANWIAHYEGTAPAIGKRFPDLDVLFVGAGTGGTLMGCVRWFRDRGTAVRVVAVDAVGSANFGGPPAARLIPGLGAHQQAPVLDVSAVHDAIHVSEVDTVRTCRALAAHGYLLGGSTGTIVNGALTWLTRNDPERTLTSVAISPDLGDRYLDTVYDDEWVLDRFGPAALEPVRWS
ncbi:cysteine synthase A [Saccharothrix tamanrassetensis]|uniref:Cysteine synthase A n=1 Tax=Saccharothrix tamanrassetensis TaxID=1051531 RepID=A0A841CXL4_9PSEU|nr:2,3-diaminopropionate biosynthesis protein SbnA [Saccharothrix tamanrassetensis]MBB5960727.1 cysteine synthase A [Saccharothrix tamanrassetensis]